MTTKKETMPHYYIDNTDPMNVIYSPLPGNAMQEDNEIYQQLTLKMLLRGFITFIAVIAILVITSLLNACTTQRINTNTSEQHLSQEVLQRMDSLLRVRNVTQQDSTWRQEILRQFQSIREKSDTSHSVMLNAAGDTIRERIIINNIRETTSGSERLEREVLMHRLETMDSTVQAQNVCISRMDSLLRQERQVVEKEVPARLNWFQQMQLWLGRLVLIAIAICAGIFIVRWWLRKKKLI